MKRARSPEDAATPPSKTARADPEVAPIPTDIWADLLPEIRRLVVRSNVLWLGDVGRMAQTCKLAYADVGPWIRDARLQEFMDENVFPPVGDMWHNNASMVAQVALARHLRRCLIHACYKADVFDRPIFPFLLSRCEREEGRPFWMKLNMDSGLPHFSMEIHFSTPPSGVERPIPPGMRAMLGQVIRLIIVPWLGHYHGGFEYAHNVIKHCPGRFDMFRMRPSALVPTQRFFMHFLSIDNTREHPNGSIDSTQWCSSQGTDFKELVTSFPLLLREKSYMLAFPTPGTTADYHDFIHSYELLKPPGLPCIPWYTRLFAEKMDRERLFFQPQMTPTTNKEVI